MEQQDKRLYKSESNKVIGGVCGGLGEYLGIDPTILRIVMVVLIFCHGAGLLIYLIAWICMPKRQVEENVYQHGYQQNSQPYYQQNNQQNNHENYHQQ
jgi:phage shock protein C